MFYTDVFLRYGPPCLYTFGGWSTRRPVGATPLNTSFNLQSEHYHIPYANATTQLLTVPRFLTSYATNCSGFRLPISSLNRSAVVAPTLPAFHLSHQFAICFPMNQLSWKRGTKKKKEMPVESLPPNDVTDEVVPTPSTATTAGPGATSDFDFTGLRNWEALRSAWTAEPIPKPASASSGARRLFRSRKEEMDEEEIYDELARPEYKLFPKNTTLTDIMKVLPEIWEKERLALLMARNDR